MEFKKSTKRPPKIEEMSKEQIRKAIIKKRECNAKAQNIVEKLLEKCVNEEYFLKCLLDINQSHFDDVIEERSILQLCGYPLCQRTLLEKDIPKQKYRISLKTNKVYDITTRKCFCSNICYKSAMHVKKQMLTSPLWFREYEEIPTGQEVDLGGPAKIEINKDDFITTSQFTKSSFQHASDIVDSNKIDVHKIETKLLTNSTDVIGSNIVNTNDENITPSNHLESSKPSYTQEPDVRKKPNKKTTNPLNIVGDIVEKPEKQIDPILINRPSSKDKEPEKPTTSLTRTIHQKKPPSITAITINVEKCLAEWCTIDTLLFIYGEENVKKMLSNKGQFITDYLNNYSKSIFYTSNTYDQYQALCRKLNLLELESRRQDAQILNKETRPLPDYSILKEESKKIQFKVRAFFAGEIEIPEPEEPTEVDASNEHDNSTVLPLVDKNSQNALRRKIVCQHLNKVLPDLLRSLGLLNLTISSDIRLLVNTFKLKADNIMFKPIQWTLIALVFIKLLSIRDEQLKGLLEHETAFKHMQLLLLSYNQDGGYLDRLISWLTDVNRLLDVNDNQMTIEKNM
ncbi:putative RNA polymerase 2 subunit B1 CTD phosphatase RPAP2 like protein [Danaus plexippus plexippus]|uniref:RNA polymerase II subunit B1 CTD phosphatase RPAP2 homolog n=1 Tax=Danaus plexippus plexippus TaxID=278856 RepID=A0A212FB88_DANPL|nr:putative RNA polymerase 2 subunit B1 CTD phosphatase RPAP2 like protein [Danaus plexippus plexippus]